MAYVTGQVINHGDYNTFATGSTSGTPNNSVANVNTIIGVGYGKLGYGQTTPLTQLTSVATSNLITATQWNTLFSRINTVANHQGTSITTLPTVVTGNEIHALSVLSTNLTAIYNAVGNTGVSYVTGNTATVNYTSPWSNQLTYTFTVSFATGDAARYFFNAGGQVQFQFSRSGGTGSAEDLDWTNTCNATGTVLFGYTQTTKTGGATGGTGSITPPVSVGYWNLTTLAQTIQQQYSSGAAPYGGANYIKTTVASNGTQGTNGDVGNILTFTITWVDAGGPLAYRQVDGTASSIGTLLLPSSTYLSQSPASWGAPTISGSVSGS
jgi:hypothetical protein